MTKEAQDEALSFFYRAIERDPIFSAPYGMAARCFWTRKVQGWMANEEREVAETKRLALHVPLIGHDDPLALSRAGFALFYVCGEYESGRTLVDQALSLTENLSVCWTNRGWISVFLGEHEQAIDSIRRTLRLSPLDPENYRADSALAYALLFLGRYDEALACSAKVRAQRPTWLIGMLTAAAAHALRNDIREAEATIAIVRRLNHEFRISDLESVMPLHKKQDAQVLAEALRRAGLPD
jgi:tetratricopeptide (TPR) repeat protein